MARVMSCSVCWAVILLVSGTLAGAATAPLSRDVTVQGYFASEVATDWWNDTGLEMQIGDQLSATCAPGLILPWPGHAGFDCTGAPATLWAQSLAPSCAFGSLVGRVGEAGTPFCLAGGGSYEVAQGGRLYLAFNDGDQFKDNSGSWTVTVTVRPAPTQNDRILAFESEKDWSPHFRSPYGPQLAASDEHTEGSKALAVTARGSFAVTSARLTTLSPAVQSLGIDFALPPQASPAAGRSGSLSAWLSIRVRIPSRGVDRVLGPVDVSAASRGAFSTAFFDLPANLLATLASAYDDLTLTVQVGTSQAGRWLFDDMGFRPSASSQVAEDSWTVDASVLNQKSLVRIRRPELRIARDEWPQQSVALTARRSVCFPSDEHSLLRVGVSGSRLVVRLAGTEVARLPAFLLETQNTYHQHVPPLGRCVLVEVEYGKSPSGALDFSAADECPPLTPDANVTPDQKIAVGPDAPYHFGTGPYSEVRTDCGQCLAFPAPTDPNPPTTPLRYHCGESVCDGATLLSCDSTGVTRRARFQVVQSHECGTCPAWLGPADAVLAPTPDDIQRRRLQWASATQHLAPCDFNPLDREPINPRMVLDYGRQTLRRTAREALEAMLTAASSAAGATASDFPLAVESAFRSFEEQQGTYLTQQHRLGDLARKASALPGRSEHQTGDAADLVARDGKPFLDRASEYYAWLERNACHYGFVQSYPRGRSHVTGYVEEPWHWRYVGVARARQMRGLDPDDTRSECQATGHSLEEYLRDHPDETLTAAPGSECDCPLDKLDDGTPERRAVVERVRTTRTSRPAPCQ